MEALCRGVLQNRAIRSQSANKRSNSLGPQQKERTNANSLFDPDADDDDADDDDAADDADDDADNDDADDAADDDDADDDDADDDADDDDADDVDDDDADDDNADDDAVDDDDERAFRKIPQLNAIPSTVNTVYLSKSHAKLKQNCDPVVGVLGPSPVFVQP